MRGPGRFACISTRTGADDGWVADKGSIAAAEAAAQVAIRLTNPRFIRPLSLSPTLRPTVEQITII